MTSAPNLAPAIDESGAHVDFTAIDSIAEGCAKLGAFLGLEGPVAPEVLISAVEDPTYANNLYLCRRTPVFLQQVLRQPTRPRPSTVGEQRPANAERSNIQLARKAALSLAKWARSGFRKVDESTYQQRLAACAACPHQVSAPGKVVYAVADAIVGSQDGKQSICDLCGCLTSAKARLAHEHCPADHPDMNGQTRWSEPKL